MGKYASEVRMVALQLVEAIVEGLGLGKEYLNEKFHEGSQLLSVDCYPKASQMKASRPSRYVSVINDNYVCD